MTSPDLDTTTPMPILDPYEAALRGEPTDPAELARDLAANPVHYGEMVNELNGLESHIAGERLYNLTDDEKTEEREGRRPTQAELNDGVEGDVAKTEVMRAALDAMNPVIPEPLPIHRAPQPGTPEFAEAEVRANRARRTLDEAFKDLSLNAHPTQGNRARAEVHLATINGILAEYPDFSGYILDKLDLGTAHVATHGDIRKVDDAGNVTYIPGNVSKKMADAENARRRHEAVDPFTEDLTTNANIKLQQERNAASFAASEAKRHAEASTAMRENMRFMIFGDPDEGAPGLSNIDMHAREVPASAYAAEVQTSEQRRRADGNDAMMAVARWNHTGNPEDESATFGPMHAMHTHLAELDSELVGMNPRHSKYSVLRAARDSLCRTIVETSFTKERVRITAAKPEGKDARGLFVDAAGRPFGNYTPDKGILMGGHRVDELGNVQDTLMVAHQDGSVQSARIVAGKLELGDRYHADGARWMQPEPFRELPPVTDPTPEAPRNFHGRLTGAVVGTMTLRGLRGASEAERVRNGEVLHDARDVTELRNAYRNLYSTSFINPANRGLANETRTTAHILRQRLEESLNDKIVEDLNPAELAALTPEDVAELNEVRETRRQINVLSHQMHFIEAEAGNDIRVSARGSLLVQDTLNGQNARWTLNPDGSTSRWGVDPATGRTAVVARYNSVGVRI
ncbi:MAG: hypothetical protein ACQR33_03985 [Candidatus Saccharibacteria bacterium]